MAERDYSMGSQGAWYQRRMESFIDQRYQARKALVEVIEADGPDDADFVDALERFVDVMIRTASLSGW